MHAPTASGSAPRRALSAAARGWRGWTAALALAAGGCRQGPSLPTVARAGEALGATFSVAAWGRDSALLERAVRQALDSVRLVDSLLSTDDDSSEISRLATAHGRARAVSPTFATVLRKALAVSRASQGAFDPTGRDYRRVVFDSARGTVALPGRLVLDFRGLAEGYALDRALLPLAALADSAILGLGGQYLIRTAPRRPGAGSGAGRQVGMSDPDNSLRAVALIELPSGTWAVSTTSQLDRPGEMLDPRSGKPATRARAVTTVARDGATAGAWSSAFFVLGCDSALALAGAGGGQLDGVGVLCVDDRVRWSADLDGRVVLATDSGESAGSGPAPGPGRAPAGARAPSGSTTRPANPDSSR